MHRLLIEFTLSVAMLFSNEMLRKESFCREYLHAFAHMNVYMKFGLLLSYISYIYVCVYVCVNWLAFCAWNSRYVSCTCICTKLYLACLCTSNIRVRANERVNARVVCTHPFPRRSVQHPDKEKKCPIKITFKAGPTVSFRLLSAFWLRNLIYYG